MLLLRLRALTFGGTFDTANEIDVNADGAQAGTSTSEVENRRIRELHLYGLLTEAVATGPTAECPGGVFVIDAAAEMGYASHHLYLAEWGSALL